MSDDTPLDDMPDDEHPTLGRLFLRLAKAIVEGRDTGPVVRDIIGYMAGLIGLANVVGRQSTLREADRVARAEGRRTSAPPPVAPPAPLPGDFMRPPSGGPPAPPRTPPPPPAPAPIQFPDRTPFKFREAIESVVKRDARLANTAADVSRTMREGGFAAAKSADVKITAKVQESIAKGIRTGQAPKTTTKIVEEVGGFTRAYSETVVRTTQGTAFAQGRDEQAKRPAMRRAMPGRELIGPKDSDARENHAAAVGLIADVLDPIWVEFLPPLGFNCRHGDRLVGRRELERKGLLRPDGSVIRWTPPGFSAAHRDVGFANVAL